MMVTQVGVQVKVALWLTLFFLPSGFELKGVPAILHRVHSATFLLFITLLFTQGLINQTWCMGYTSS